MYEVMTATAHPVAWDDWGKPIEFVRDGPWVPHERKAQSVDDWMRDVGAAAMEPKAYLLEGPEGLRDVRVVEDEPEGFAAVGIRAE